MSNIPISSTDILERLLKHILGADVVWHTYNPGSWVVDSGRYGVQCHPRLYNEFKATLVSVCGTVGVEEWWEGKGKRGSLHSVVTPT